MNFFGKILHLYAMEWDFLDENDLELPVYLLGDSFKVSKKHPCHCPLHGQASKSIFQTRKEVK